MINLKTTKGFKIVSGITPGYSHANENSFNIDEMSELWNRIALKVMDITGIYVSSIVQHSKTVYNVEWGCPIGGEDTVTITGVCNTKFVKDISKYLDSVGLCAIELKKRLKQSTLTIEFFDEQIGYLEDKEND